MCLFLQNQRFQEVTAALVTDMATATRAAHESLAGVSGDLAEQRAALEGSAAQLGRLQTVQNETLRHAARGAEGVAALIGKSDDLARAMARSLQMSVRGCDSGRAAASRPARPACSPAGLAGGLHAADTVPLVPPPSAPPRRATSRRCRAPQPRAWRRSRPASPRRPRPLRRAGPARRPPRRTCRRAKGATSRCRRRCWRHQKACSTARQTCGRSWS
jgi:hypothetical protein